MFCTNCGKKVPDGSKFCPACGTLLYGEEEQTTVKEHTPIADPSPRPESEPKIKLTKEDQAAVAPSGSIEEVIGKNTAYYLSEFKKVDEGQKVKFNLAAFFLGLFFCFYRKCGDLFKKYFLIPIVIVIAALIVVTIGTTSFSIPVMIVGGILSAIGSIWALVSYIRFGKNFNRDYYEHCKAVLSTGNKKKYGTSIGSALIVVAAVVLLSMVPYIVSLISLFGSSSDLDDYKNVNSISDNDDGTLDGEYVIVEDATSNEFIYLNFNWNGPGTLQISSSEDPTEIGEATYSIVPTDDIMEGIDSYTLIVNNDYLGGDTEFFNFCVFSDNIYYIVFSESFADEDGETAMMVPRTEEYGFTSDSGDSDALFRPNTEPASTGNIPSWCSGSYYGDDIYSTITFSDMENGPSNGLFDIWIYRLVRIENCTGTGNGDEFYFTGDLDIGFGSVSGILKHRDNGDIILTISESNWDLLPAGTSMLFYYEFLGDFSYLDMGEAPYNLSGIYVSSDVPSNRIFISGTDDMIIIEIMNRSDTAAVATIGQYDLENINDTIYFSTYTVGSEEALYGSYDPYLEILDIQVNLLDFEGMYFKQST